MNFTNDNNAKRYLELLEIKSSNPDSISLLEIVNTLSEICSIDFLAEHKSFNEGFISAKNRIRNKLVLRYEDFIAGNTQDLNDYLGTNVVPSVALPKKLSIISRTKSQGEWLNWCTQSDLDFFPRTFANFNHVFEYDFSLLGNEPDKIISYDKSVGYITRCITDYRRRYKLPDYDGTIRIGKEGELFDQAERLFQSKKFRQAEQILRQVIQNNPALPGFYLFLSRLLERQGHFQDAINEASNAIHIDQENSYAHILIAELYCKTHKAEKALTHAEQAISLTGTQAPAYIQLAHALSQLNRLDEAIAQIKIAIALDPENPFPISFLADLHLKQRNATDAARIMRTAIAQKPDFPRFHFQLSRALEQSGQIKAARDALKTALEFDKDNEHYQAFMEKLSAHED